MKIINKENYLYVYANVFFVKGYTRTMICDISKSEWEFIDNSFYNLYELFRKYTIKDIIENHLDEGSREEFEKFVTFIIENDYGTFVNEIENFPKIKIEWDSPNIINNAIIDINKNSDHNYLNIIDQLNVLNCEYIQIRSYDSLTEEHVTKIASQFSNKDLKSIHLITKYNSDISTHFYTTLISEFPSISITIHTSPKNEFHKTKISSFLTAMGYIQYIKQEIDSCESCGIINKATFNITSNLKTFVEGIACNSCLNRKISIDHNGDIKNCPSMKSSYGNIDQIELKEVVKNPEFKKYWEITKDQIDICKDCEYRYVCSDCRAYTQEAKNEYSKPLKCGYDPYKGKWDAGQVNKKILKSQ